MGSCVSVYDPVFEDFPWWTPLFFLGSFLIGLGSLVIFLIDKALD